MSPGHLGTPLTIHLEGDNCWPDLKEKEFSNGQLESLALLEHATAQDRPAVTLRVELADGTTILAQTTRQLFLTAADAFRSKLHLGPYDTQVGG